MRVSMKYCIKYLKERKNILEAAYYYNSNNNNPTNISTNPIPKILQPLPPYLF